MNVVINCRFLTQSITGVQRYGIEIVKRLIDINQGVKYKCISPIGILDANLQKELNVEIVGKHTGHIWEQLDLVSYLNSNGSPLLLNLANTGPLYYLNNIITIHDLAFTKDKRWFSFTFRKVYNFLIPRLIKKARHVISVSEFSKNEIINYYNTSKKLITVAYNGVEHLPIINDNIEKSDYYLVVGSLDLRKNLELVINAFNILNLPLKIVGGNSKSFGKQKKIDVVDNIEFLGRVSDEELSLLYMRSKGFIYMSLYEGFGIPPIEAINYKTTPIVSDIEVFHEILGDYARYCNPYNLEELISSIKMYDDDNYKNEITNYVVDSFREKYSWNKSATIINDIIINLN